MSEENKLVLAHAYWVNSPFQYEQEGFFVGNPNNPSNSYFAGKNNLEFALKHAVEESRTKKLPINCYFEGLSQDEERTFLLEPIQEAVSQYKGVDKLRSEHLNKN
jgi:hypothetical protein